MIKQSCLLALVASACLFAPHNASAFPPTATTSPGYDRALAESRKARQIETPVIVPTAPTARPRVYKRHLKRH